MALGRLRANMAMEEDEFARLLKVACTRDLTGQPFPVAHLAAFYSKRRVGETAVFRTFVMATGVTEEGDLEPLAVGVGDSEEAAFWAMFPEARWHQAETLENLAEDAPAPALFHLHLMEDDHIDDQSAEDGVPSDQSRRAR